MAGRHEGSLHTAPHGCADLPRLRAALPVHLRHYEEDYGATETARHSGAPLLQVSLKCACRILIQGLRQTQSPEFSSQILLSMLSLAV